MIRRFRHWLRVVQPIDQLAYIVLAVLFALTSARLIRDRGPGDELAIWQIYLVYGSTILYAAFRAIYFHPVENRRYGNWLADSPWKYPQPLPLGPLQLVWQDALLILILSAFIPAEIVSRWSVLILFVFVYCFGLGFNFCRMGVYAPLFLMGFLVGWFILALPHALWCTAIALTIYGVAFWGIRLLLQQISDGEEVPQHVGWGLPTGQVEPLLGWPVPPFRTERYQWGISHRDALQFAMVVGWLFFCIAWRAREANDYEEGLAIGLGWIAIVAILGRVFIYVVGYVPPISLLGRIFLWRWIIPGYDYVLFAPLAALLAAIILPNIGKSLGVPIPIVYPVTAAVVTWLALALPPRRADWQLTGHHRIAYRLRAAAYEKTAASKMIPRTK